MIRPITKSEFINIATNGIKINLYDGYVEDYIENLIKFIEDTTYDFYISDFDTTWCEISKAGVVAVKVIYGEGKANFYISQQNFKNNSEKAAAGSAIKIVYMHSIAWEAINNDGNINQPVESWPI